jgi:hypothetical protein
MSQIIHYKFGEVGDRMLLTQRQVAFEGSR